MFCFCLLLLILVPDGQVFQPAVVTGPCYHGDSKRPHYCIPDFLNAALGREVQVSSVCGAEPEKYCRLSRRKGRGVCRVCDSSRPAAAHPASYLTDHHDASNRTCWQSETGVQFPQNVTLTLSLGGKFEVSHISLRFCSQPPESLAIYKSMDAGRTWVPFQFYSGQCRKMYGQPRKRLIPKLLEHEAICSRLPRGGRELRNGGLLTFLPLQGRPSAPSFEYSPVLQDWITATDIRVAFHRLHATDSRGLGAETLAFYAVADFRVGGRCKCNGHASHCHQGDGSSGMSCVCEHHTAGAECNVCKAFYQDRPWQRATPDEPHECVACNCNLHSTRCRFNMELFQLSGRKSGGICLNCRHNTAGRHCHYCKEGYTRDASKPTSHRRACRRCQCHRIGAIDTFCNETSGQCRCKDGVVGLTCNRCAAGYRQSQSAVSPCKRIEETTPTTAAYQSDQRAGSEPVGSECGSYCKPNRGEIRMDFRDYCKKDYVLHMRPIAMEKSGPWWKFTVVVVSVFRQQGPRIRRGEQSLWVPDQDLSCHCPWLQLGGAGYLLIGDRGASPDRSQLVADRTSLALPWREVWAQKLRRFQQGERRGDCNET
nr:PREDICTED: netrin-1-like isoform X1 [Latimeria chalumnae]|eukprot:XP_006010131.2 PREDICTED: netrin-1-like isoform X1 [Latimeria chalumnae]